MLEHPLAVLDLAAAQPAGVGPVQARGMSFEPRVVPLEAGGRLGAGAARPQRETNDHEDDDTGMP